MENVIISLVQGITEFLPISSSGHLLLLYEVFNFKNQGSLIDIASHVGTLFAVLIFFRKNIKLVILGFIDFFNRKKTKNNFYFKFLFLSTLPIFIIGFCFKEYINIDLRYSSYIIEVIAYNSIVFGIILYFVDKFSASNKRVKNLGLSRSFFVGLLQTIALIPGVSRAGICMIAFRLLNVNAKESAKFSMLLAIPTILGAGFIAFNNVEISSLSTQIKNIGLVIFLSFIFAIISIFYLVKYINKFPGNVFLFFAIYRVLLGIFLLIFIT